MESHGAGVEKAQDDRLLVGGHAQDRRDTAQFRGAHEILALARLHRAVFGVEDQKVPPALG